MLYPSRRLVAKCIFTFLVLLMQASLGTTFCKAEGGSESPDGIARPVTINFDTLQTNSVLPANQYQIASFSSYAGGTIYTQYDCGFGGSCPNGIAIRYITNYDSFYYSDYLLYYDDFTFTPELTTNIISPRVNGGLDQTTQNGLAGADIPLQASVSQGGGTYSWSFTGPPYSTTSGSASSSSITIQPTDIGTINAKLTYTLNGVSVTPSVNINVIIPALTSFTATEVSDSVNRDLHCSNQAAGVTYTLGCYQGQTEDGIIWTASAQIPSVTYLSDPAQSGIKFVQAVSEYRKRLRDGNTQCLTARSSQSDIGSGWQLDTSDPYNHLEHPERYFSEGNTVTMGDFDAPGARLEGTSNNIFFSDDARFVSDSFETYVFYFTTNSNPAYHDPTHPIFQRAIGLQGSAFPYARLAWSWGAKYCSTTSAFQTVYCSPGSSQVRFQGL